MRDAIEALCAGEDLGLDRSEELFGRIVRGELEPPAIAGLLVALKAKGETPDEIAGAALALRHSALPLPSGDIAVADTCGTGGDGAGTVNISTAAAVVVAECGVPVAKHGNRSVSSRCGSADVLEGCGVRIDATPETSVRCLQELRLCFLFAPQYHAGMRHAMPARRALGTRTIFNVAGPLTNPAAPRWQLVGVYDPELCVPVAKTLQRLGCDAALVVHGGGLDEIALHAPTRGALLSGGEVDELELDPGGMGLRQRPLAELRGGDPAENAAWLRALLEGRGTPAHREAVAANAGALLWISGRTADLREGAERALTVLDGDRAAQRLTRWVERSHA